MPTSLAHSRSAPPLTRACKESINAYSKASAAISRCGKKLHEANPRTARKDMHRYGAYVSRCVKKLSATTVRCVAKPPDRRKRKNPKPTIDTITRVIPTSEEQVEHDRKLVVAVDSLGVSTQHMHTMQLTSCMAVIRSCAHLDICMYMRT